MYLGTYEPNLIGEKRLALPKEIRNELAGDQVVLTSGFEECIFGFSKKEWEQTIQPELAKPISDVGGREIRRRMFADAAIVDLDMQGRFVLTENLIRYAKITSGLTVIGAGDHFEIWDSRKWQEYHEKLMKSS